VLQIRQQRPRVGGRRSLGRSATGGTVVGLGGGREPGEQVRRHLSGRKRQRRAVGVAASPAGIVPGRHVDRLRPPRQLQTVT